MDEVREVDEVREAELEGVEEEVMVDDGEEVWDPVPLGVGEADWEVVEEDEADGVTVADGDADGVAVADEVWDEDAVAVPEGVGLGLGYSAKVNFNRRFWSS